MKKGVPFYRKKTFQTWSQGTTLYDATSSNHGKGLAKQDSWVGTDTRETWEAKE